MQILYSKLLYIPVIIHRVHYELTLEFSLDSPIVFIKKVFNFANFLSKPEYIPLISHRSPSDTKSPLSPAACGPSSVSVMSYEGTIFSESKSKVKQAGWSSPSITMTKNSRNQQPSPLPSRPNIPVQKSSSTSAAEQTSRSKIIPLKNIFVPGTGWASQVSCCCDKVAFS